LTREKLIEYFSADEFQISNTNIAGKLTINPDLLIEKNSLIKAIVIRESSDNLSDAFVQRFSESKRINAKTLEIYFAFPSKPTPTTFRLCKLFGVGILYTDTEDQIQIYVESIQIKGRRNVNAIPKTNIFFSSRQSLPERLIAEDSVTDIRDSLGAPLFAMLVENDQHYSNDIRKLWRIICKCMDECTYVLIIISGEYRKIIDRETRRALDLYDPEEILFYVQNDKYTKEQWNDLLEFATTKGVKYSEYFDSRRFKLKFNERLMIILKDLHDEYDVPFLSRTL